MLSRFVFTPVLLFALVIVPGSGASLRQPQQLSADGASSEANPEVDAWHEQERAKIEEECDEMMRRLWAQKRQKLQDIVDALRRQVEEERARVAAAKGDVNDELGELETERGHLADAGKKIRLGPDRDRVADLEARIRDLERKIAEKQACVDELEQAERDLAEALRRLAEAERKVEAARAAHADQVNRAQVEASHVPPAQADVEAAEDCLARAKARVDAARRRLATAKQDLAEHDTQVSSGDALMHNAAPQVESPPIEVPEVNDREIGAPRSGTVTPRSNAVRKSAGFACVAMALLVVMSVGLVD